MSYPTEKQVSYANRLAKQSGFESGVEAVTAYGFGIKSVSSLTGREVSQLIEWLCEKNGIPMKSAPVKPGSLIGRRVRHAVFGEGEVVRFERKELIIRFPGLSLRTFPASSLEILGA